MTNVMGAVSITRPNPRETAAKPSTTTENNTATVPTRSK